MKTWGIYAQLLRLEIAIIKKHPPVEDAIPERLPQARPTTALESSGLHLKEIEKYYFQNHI